MVLLILAVVWGVVLIPPALRARSEASPVDSIGAFQRQLHVLERTSPQAAAAGAHRIAPYQPTAPVRRPANPARPMAAVPTVSASAISKAQARQRRRDIFLGLAVAVPTTLVAAVIISTPVMWLLHLAVDAAFAGFVTLLIRSRNLAAEREMKVRYLPSTGDLVGAATPELAFQQSAN